MSAPDDENKRAAQRRKVLKSGKALLGDLSVVDLVIRDQSDTGARLAVGDDGVLPPKFRLVSLADNTIRDVVVRWRRPGLVGVAFEGEARRAPPRKW